MSEKSPGGHVVLLGSLDDWERRAVRQRGDATCCSIPYEHFRHARGAVGVRNALARWLGYYSRPGSTRADPRDLERPCKRPCAWSVKVTLVSLARSSVTRTPAI